MKDLFNKVLTWAKSNMLLAIGALLAVIMLFFPKLLKGLFGTTRRRHRRIAGSPYSTGSPYRRNKRRTLPRSVGMRKIRRQYTKGGKVKKPWQIKGSIAARRHMAQIRRMR